MMRTIMCIMLLTFLLTTSAPAQHGGFGAGLILGEPTGISVKSWLSNSTAFDAAIAWSFGDEDAFHLHADYLFHNFSLLSMKKGEVPVYYGVGGRIKFRDDTEVGVRFPVGIDYIFADPPIDIFIEIVPLLDLVPSTEFDLNAAIGFRYFFR